LLRQDYSCPFKTILLEYKKCSGWSIIFIEKAESLPNPPAPDGAVPIRTWQDLKKNQNILVRKQGYIVHTK
jgi:hypothetical protein